MQSGLRLVVHFVENKISRLAACIVSIFKLVAVAKLLEIPKGDFLETRSISSVSSVCF